MIPDVLASQRAELESTRQSFVRILAQKTRKTELWESKIGGMPYLPVGMAWPTTPEGSELFFLAQINFAEMPNLAPFPEKGIVQFYINDDDLYGMDFDEGTTQDTFRVLWHADPVQDAKQLRTDGPLSREYEELPHHPDVPYPLKYELADELMPTTDYQFAERFGAAFFEQFGDAEWDTQEAYDKAIRSDGHKIGGYAYFLQDDPRTAKDPMLLLLQIDSDEPMDLLWGDTGVGHFFIRASDLAARDFSKVLYDWDCM
jgi:uncharacterized protein YwqG